MKSASSLAMALATFHGLVAAASVAVPPTLSTFPIEAASTSTSSAPAGTPAFIFNKLPSSEIETCSTNFTISWLWGYDGALPAKGFTLSVTNINVTQQAPPSTLSSSSSFTFSSLLSQTGDPFSVINLQLIPSVAKGSILSTGTVSAAPGASTPLSGFIESWTTSLNPRTQNNFTWNNVNLPQAWYRILVTATDAGNTEGIWSAFNAASDPFFIQNGSDTSCLSLLDSSTSDSSGNTANSSPSKHLNRGAIGGGVVGAIAAVAVILGAYWIYRQSRRRKAMNSLNATYADDSPHPNIDQWGALNSFDPKSKEAGLDPTIALNTPVTSRQQQPSEFSLGNIGFAALSLVRRPLSTHTVRPKRPTRRSKHNSTGSTESTGAMMTSFLSHSSFSATSFVHGHFDPYNSRGVEESGLEMGVSPNSSSLNRDESQQLETFVSSIDSLGSGAPGAEAIPVGYQWSPLATPLPSQPASRRDSRSRSTTSLPSAKRTSSSTDMRSKYQIGSPTSPRLPRHVPEVPRNDFTIKHQKRGSSPDATAYTLGGGNSDDSQVILTRSSKGSIRRKPVPSYEINGLPADSPVLPDHPYPGTTSTQAVNPATPKRRPLPVPPTSESSLSSYPSSQRLHQPSVHSLKHTNSIRSLGLLRKMEGDLTGYGTALGREGGKQMHELIPDMPPMQS